LKARRDLLDHRAADGGAADGGIGAGQARREEVGVAPPSSSIDRVSGG